MYKNLTTICAVAALALGLAACGGGGSDERADMGGGAQMCPEGQVGTPPNCMMPEPPGPTAESLKADAADATTAAEAAGMAATQAEKDAIKYAGMLTAESVKGDSSKAIENAEEILAAEMAANKAVMDADDALQDAMAAETSANALPEDDPERAGAIAAAERAVEEAKAQKAAAQAILDKNLVGTDGTTPTPEVDSLKDAVALVKGANRLADDYPMMPAAIGKTIATDVGEAIIAAAPATNGTFTAGTTPMDGIKNDAADIGAMTWAMIVGEDNVVSQRISTGTGPGGTGTITALTEVKASSFAGMDTGDTNVFAAAPTNVPDTGTNAALGLEVDQQASYKGIQGRVFCGGDDCSRDADGKLTGSWLFRPDSPDEFYVAANAGTYKVAALYATYGYWLTYNTDATPTGEVEGGVNLYSTTTAPSTTADVLNLGQEGEGANAKDVTATYSGSAVGISKRGDASGQFTADVNLTAKFAVAPSLRGSISNFKGNAVGNWTVLLNETLVDTTTAGFTTGVTGGGGTSGVWTAQAYGPAPVDHDGDGTTLAQNQRPTGFHGRFTANFGDGAAAGAYATRK